MTVRQRQENRRTIKTFQSDIKKGSRLGPFFIPISIGSFWIWKPGAKFLVVRLFYYIRAPKRCMVAPTELTHLNH